MKDAVSCIASQAEEVSGFGVEQLYFFNQRKSSKRKDCIAFQYILHYKTFVSIGVTKEVLEKTLTVEKNQT